MLYLVEGALLVGRRRELKVGRERLHALVVLRADLARELLALGVHLDQIGRHGPYLLGRTLLALLPRLARAQPVEAHGAVVTHLLAPLEELDVVGGVPRIDLERAVAEAHLQGAPAHLRAVGQVHQIGRLKHAFKVADAVLPMHDVIAPPDLRLGQLRQLYPIAWRACRSRCGGGSSSSGAGKRRGRSDSGCGGGACCTVGNHRQSCVSSVGAHRPNGGRYPCRR